MSKQGESRTENLSISGEPNRFEIDTLMKAFAYAAPLGRPFQRPLALAQSELLCLGGSPHESS